MTDTDLFIEHCSSKQVLDKDDWTVLAGYVKNGDYDIKYDICELLSCYTCVESEELLYILLNDEDNLIRASACEALSFSKSEKTISLLHNKLRDKDKLVRAYAALSIGDIVSNLKINSHQLIETIRFCFNKEKSNWCKTAFARTLFLLGEAEYYDYITEMINNRFYRNRSFALNLLIELIKVHHINIDKDKLAEILIARKDVEYVLCVQESIDNLLILCVPDNLLNKK